MKVATWNVNSIYARLPLVLKWLAVARPDVLCLQEVKCLDERFPRDAFTELGYAVETYGQRTYNGVAIVARAPLGDVQRGFHGDALDAQRRLLAATVGGVRVVNVYVPNGQAVGTDKYEFKLRWMRELQIFFAEHYSSSSSVLLCGDFNVAPEDRDVYDPALWRGRILCSEPERAALGAIKAWGFVDALRMHTEEGGQFSWWDYRAGGFRRNLGLRIDHIWISQSLARRCTNAWIDKEPRGWERPSDHTPVVVELNMEEFIH